MLKLAEIRDDNAATFTYVRHLPAKVKPSVPASEKLRRSLHYRHRIYIYHLFVDGGPK